MTDKKTSVIIVTYHTGAILFRSIESVLRQKNLGQLIIVDNGNPNDVVEQLQAIEQQNENFKLITGYGNIGFSKACNRGASAATGDYILLLNPDCLLQREAIVTAMAAMAEHPEVWVAGCQMIRPDGSLQGGSKRNLLTPNVAFSQSLGIHKMGGYFKPINIAETIDEAKDTAKAIYVPAISGAFMMFPRDKYRKLNGLDEDYFFHVEDLDLCYRVHKIGGKILYIPTVKATHFCSSSEVSSYFVEKHKADGFIKYFSKYKELSSSPLYFCIIMGIYLRLWLRLPILYINRLLTKQRNKYTKIKIQRQLDLLNHAVPKEKIVKSSAKIQPVLIAGSTGQVGLAIIRRLLANNTKTYCFYHNQVIDYTHPKLQWIQADLSTNHIGINGEVIKQDQPKTLIHTPAIWMLPDRLEMYINMGIKRIICFSSTSIQGKAKTTNDYEKQLIEKFTHAEEELLKRGKESGVEITILRPTMIYGFGIDRNVTSIVKFIDVFGFFPVAIPSDGSRMPVHADDLAKAAIATIDNPATYGKIYNLCGKTKLSYFEMVNKIFNVLGKQPRTYRVFGLSIILDIFSFLTNNKDTNGEVAKRMNQDLSFCDKEAQNDFNYRPREFLSGEEQDLGVGL